MEGNGNESKYASIQEHIHASIFNFDIFKIRNYASMYYQRPNLTTKYCMFCATLLPPRVVLVYFVLVAFVGVWWTRSGENWNYLPVFLYLSGTISTLLWMKMININMVYLLLLSATFRPFQYIPATFSDFLILPTTCPITFRHFQLPRASFYIYQERSVYISTFHLPQGTTITFQ